MPAYEGHKAIAGADLCRAGASHAGATSGHGSARQLWKLAPPSRMTLAASLSRAIFRDCGHCLEPLLRVRSPSSNGIRPARRCQSRHRRGDSKDRTRTTRSLHVARRVTRDAGATLLLRSTQRVMAGRSYGSVDQPGPLGARVALVCKRGDGRPRRRRPPEGRTSSQDHGLERRPRSHDLSPSTWRRRRRRFAPLCACVSLAVFYDTSGHSRARAANGSARAAPSPPPTSATHRRPARRRIGSGRELRRDASLTWPASPGYG